jgi:hypothetical protein
MMKPLEIQLVQGKETKGTYRYESPDPNAMITTLYIRKDAFAGKPAPQAIRLVVEDASTQPQG